MTSLMVQGLSLCCSLSTFSQRALSLMIRSVIFCSCSNVSSDARSGSLYIYLTISSTRMRCFLNSQSRSQLMSLRQERRWGYCWPREKASSLRIICRVLTYTDLQMLVRMVQTSLSVRAQSDFQSARGSRRRSSSWKGRLYFQLMQRLRHFSTLSRKFLSYRKYPSSHCYQRTAWKSTNRCFYCDLARYATVSLNPASFCYASGLPYLRVKQVWRQSLREVLRSFMVYCFHLAYRMSLIYSSQERVSIFLRGLPRSLLVERSCWCVLAGECEKQSTFCLACVIILEYSFEFQSSTSLTLSSSSTMYSRFTPSYLLSPAIILSFSLSSMPALAARSWCTRDQSATVCVWNWLQRQAMVLVRVWASRGMRELAFSQTQNQRASLHLRRAQSRMTGSSMYRARYCARSENWSCRVWENSWVRGPWRSSRVSLLRASTCLERARRQAGAMSTFCCDSSSMAGGCYVIMIGLIYN